MSRVEDQGPELGLIIVPRKHIQTAEWVNECYEKVGRAMMVKTGVKGSGVPHIIWMGSAIMILADLPKLIYICPKTMEK